MYSMAAGYKSHIKKKNQIYFCTYGRSQHNNSKAINLQLKIKNLRNIKICRNNCNIMHVHEKVKKSIEKN